MRLRGMGEQYDELRSLYAIRHRARVQDTGGSQGIPALSVLRDGIEARGMGAGGTPGEREEGSVMSNQMAFGFAAGSKEKNRSFNGRWRNVEREMSRECLHCGKSIRIAIREVKRGRGKFCSRKCYDRARQRRVTKTCPTCAKVFESGIWEKKTNCSVRCLRDHQTKRPFRKCIICGERLHGVPSRLRTKKYCSRECLGKAQRKRVIIICPSCSKSFEGFPSQDRIYCSRECKWSYLSGEIKRTGKKQCASCEQFLSVEYFRKDKSNRSGMTSRCRKCLKEQYKEGPSRKLRRFLSMSCFRLFKDSSKKKGWIEELPFSIIEAVKDIEEKWMPGMSWENYGTAWHIGHEIPVSSFVLESIHDPLFKVAFDLRNFQPEWQYDNVAKGARIVVVDKTLVELAKEIIAISVEDSCEQQDRPA